MGVGCVLLIVATIAPMYILSFFMSDILAALFGFMISVAIITYVTLNLLDV